MTQNSVNPLNGRSLWKTPVGINMMLVRCLSVAWCDFVLFLHHAIPIVSEWFCFKDNVAEHILVNLYTTLVCVVATNFLFVIWSVCVSVMMNLLLFRTILNTKLIRRNQSSLSKSSGHCSSPGKSNMDGKDSLREGDSLMKALIIFSMMGANRTSIPSWFLRG